MQAHLKFVHFLVPSLSLVNYSRFRELEEFPDNEVPKNFDAREKWPMCPSLNYVPNQGGCGSCFVRRIFVVTIFINIQILGRLGGGGCIGSSVHSQQRHIQIVVERWGSPWLLHGVWKLLWRGSLEGPRLLGQGGHRHGWKRWLPPLLCRYRMRDSLFARRIPGRRIPTDLYQKMPEYLLQK